MTANERQPITSDETTAHQTMKKAMDHKQFCKYKSFVAYAWDLIRSTRLVALWQRILTLFRRVRLLTVTVRILTLLFSFLQAGTLLLLSTALLLVLLPLLLLALIVTLTVAFFQSGKSNRLLRERTSGRQIYVLFLDREHTPFFEGNVRSLAKGDAVVLIVSPFWLSGKGLRKKGFYSTVRQEEKNVYLLRRYYFFSMKKQVRELARACYLY